MDHELKGNATLVLAKMVKLVPGALVKLNWNVPLPSRVAPVSSGGVGGGPTTTVRVTGVATPPSELLLV